MTPLALALLLVAPGEAPARPQVAIAWEKHFDDAEKRGRLRLVASPDGREGSVTIHQDALVYAGLLDGTESVSHAIAPGRRAYVHVARGEVSANGQRLRAGDALKVTGLALTKLDGTARGGVIAAIAKERPIPIRFIGIGEKIDDLQVFNKSAFVDSLFDRNDR